VDSTALASQLDPEEWRDVVRAYQSTCAKVIQRFEGHIAQYLGDGLLVYFGYPLAHEDDAQRAVRTGLGIVEAMAQLNTRLEQERGVQLAVRLGCHTGLVVVGEVGGGTWQEQLALGETPNLAARLQGIAAPNTVVISATTLPLRGGFFACQSLGAPPLKGVGQPLEVYQVLSERRARSRLEAAGSTGLTPFVGRELEVALLQERWAQVKDGLGHILHLPVFQQTGAHAEFPQFSADRGLAHERCSVSACQGVPALPVGYFQGPHRHRGQCRAWPRLGPLTEVYDLHHRRLVCRGGLQFPQEERQLTGDVLLRHVRRPPRSSPASASRPRRLVGTGAGRGGDASAA
jgi:class 3 adenylate cyclase